MTLFLNRSLMIDMNDDDDELRMIHFL